MLAQDLLFDFLKTRLNAASISWLEKSVNAFSNVPDDKTVFTTFSASIRLTGKAPLMLNETELSKAKALVPDWNPIDWTIDQTARIILLLALPPTLQSAKLMDLIYQTADVGEALALLKALPLLTNPLNHLARAREGARSNVKSQFEAVALRSPYAADHFDENAWNQLVSKAIFIDSPLDEFVGLERRANKVLDHILVDLIKERRAAGRSFTPFIYRCMDQVTAEKELDLMS